MMLSIGFRTKFYSCLVFRIRIHVLFSTKMFHLKRKGIIKILLMLYPPNFPVTTHLKGEGGSQELRLGGGRAKLRGRGAP